MASRPNLLFIMPDQLRHDFLSCYGADFISTPNIDRIASEGIRYERAYSLHPACVPARIALLTGQNAIRNGVLGNGNTLRPDHVACGINTWPELLAAAGYHTSAIGKMHFYPWDAAMGFHHRIICEDKRWIQIQDDYYHYLAARGHYKYHGNEHQGYQENRGAIVSRLPWDCYWDYFVGEAAARTIRDYEGEQPFAMMVGFPGPHCPYDPTQEFLDRVDLAAMPAAAPDAGDTPLLRKGNVASLKGDWNGVDYSVFTDEHKAKIRAHYAALVLQIDQEVGNIISALEARGILDNTVIIFASDHGDYLGDHNLMAKSSFYEGSCHVPLLVRAPGVQGGQISDALASLTDVTAMLLAFAGEAVPDHMEARVLPGLGLEAGSARETLFGMNSGAWMAFDGRWKLAKYSTGEQTLFDLDQDPLEQRNLLRIGGSEQQRERLDALLTQEIMRSIAASHRDKAVVAGWDSDQFALAGQSQLFPAPMA